MKKEIKKPLPNNLKKKNTKNFAKRILLGLFIFWTIGSLVALSCLVWLFMDNYKDNSAMVMASAEDVGLHDSVPLIGLKSSYVNDGDICLFSDNLTLAVSAPVGGFALSSELETVSYMYEDINTWRYIECNFFDAETSLPTSFVLEFKILNNSYTLLDSTYRLTSIFYSQYDVSSTISVALRYNNGSNNVFITMHLRSEELFDFVLVDSVDMPVDYGEQYVNNLRMQITDLNRQIAQLNSTIVTLRADISAMEDLHDYEVEQLNAQLLSLSNTIAEKNALIEELNAEIRDITAGNQNAYNSGYSAGFEDGATATSQDAYNQGYADAVADGEGGGNFRSLIGALIDVPVNAITSLLDWNLLGINLKEFFFSILSVIVVIKIAMLFMR